jgi:hypothetical protein
MPTRIFHGLQHGLLLGLARSRTAHYQLAHDITQHTHKLIIVVYCTNCALCYLVPLSIKLLYIYASIITDSATHPFFGSHHMPTTCGSNPTGGPPCCASGPTLCSTCQRAPGGARSCRGRQTERRRRDRGRGLRHPRSRHVGLRRTCGRVGPRCRLPVR